MVDTKQNPDPNSCYARALPDEPRFTLLGRDPAGPATIRFWRDERMRLNGDAADEENEAFAIAAEFEDWRSKNDGRWREELPEAAAVEEPEPEAKQPVPSDALSSLAGKVTGGYRPTLPEAKRLAAFVLGADPRKGPNKE